MVRIDKQEQINVAFSKQILKDMRKHGKDYGYSNLPEFIREAVREKLYGTLQTRRVSNGLEIVSKKKKKQFLERY